ncbi:MAG: hypothetical protein ACI4M6_00410 [Christensenellaceae bacterium]
MKKVIAKLVSLILSITLLATIVSACDWVTTNTDRNVSQIVATVKIDDAIDSENVYKKELVAGYMSYGYQYVYYSGYTESQAYKQVLDDLIQNRIIVQYARIELAKTYNENLTKSDAALNDYELYLKNNALANGQPIDPRSSDIENLKNYLTSYEVAEIYYNLRKNVNSFIESYVEEDEEADVKEDVTYDERTAPTSAKEEDKTEGDYKTTTPTDDEYDIANVVLKDDSIRTKYADKYSLDTAVFNQYKIDVASSNARRKAYNKMLDFLRDNGLILSDENYNYVENTDAVLNYSYFANLLKTQLESKVVSKFEESLVFGTEAKLGNDGLWTEYKKDYDYQEALYKNDLSAFATALEGASDTSFILYNPLEGDNERQFGYVLNILIPFSDEQTKEMTDYKAKPGATEKGFKDLRTSLAGNIMASDQRSSWVYNNCGTYDKDTNTFEFVKEHRASESDLLKNFIGEIVVKDPEGFKNKDDNGVEKTAWEFENAIASKMTMSDLFNDYVKPLTGIEEKYFVENDAATIGRIELTSEKLSLVKELMFTFSTDAGCLGLEYGYVYSPISSNYVEEFTKASKAVVKQGVGAYTTVLTDYGYHIVVCTKTVETPYNVATDKEAFIADLADSSSLAYKYRKNKLDSVVDDEISKVSQKIITTNKDNESKIKYYPKTYKDIIKE